MVVTMKVVMVKKVNVMSATKSIKLLILIALLSYSCYKFGQGSPVIVEKTVEVKVYDAGFCASCYKDHSKCSSLHTSHPSYDLCSKRHKNLRHTP
jgi:predicted transglutaminase-like cysteine proteinase